MPDASCVYLFRAKHSDRYKIGRSKNPAARQKTLERELGVKLELLHQISVPDDAPAVERHLQHRFASRKVKAEKEWFRLRSEDIAWLCSHSTLSILDFPPRYNLYSERHHSRNDQIIAQANRLADLLDAIRQVGHDRWYIDDSWRIGGVWTAECLEIRAHT